MAQRYKGIKPEQLVKPVVIGVLVALVVKIVSKFLDKGLGSNVKSIRVGNDVTMSDTEITLAVNDLLQAMDRWGTDEATIYAVFDRLNTRDDLLKVIKAFGTRPYNGLGQEDTVIGKLWFSDEKDLRGWLRAELNRSELAKVKEYFNNLGVSF